MKTSRRDFMRTVGGGMAALGIAAAGGGPGFAAPKREFKISLAAWSFHVGVGSGKVNMLDLPKIARQDYDIEGLELVNRMLEPCDKPFAEQKPYLDQLAKNATDNNVKIVLIMVDGEGAIGSRDEPTREQAIAKHSKWVDIAQYLGCHSIRMNWVGAPRGSEKDAQAIKGLIERSAPAFRKLCDYADTKNINVLIENHGGPSSYPETMKQLMEAVSHKRFGTLPDFGNFPPDVDRYNAVDVMMNWAKAVSAKCKDFNDATGDETTIDFGRLIEIAVDKHDYHSYIGIEYEGERLSEADGVRACKKLLDKLRA